MRRSRTLSIAIPLAAAAVGWSTSATSADKPILRLRASAIDVGAVTPSGARPASAGILEIGIERWTTDEEHKRVASVLTEKGPDGLMSTMQKLPRAGYIRTTRSLGWDIHYARRYPLPDGGQRIVFATDRPMNFWELWNRPQSADYQYMFAEVRLGADGRGQGTLVPVARIDYDADTSTIEVENYASQPVRLSEVRIEK
jgi:hypothetical protein